MNKIIRFFSPIKEIKIPTLKMVFSWALTGLYWSLNVYFLQRIIYLLNNNLIHDLKGITIVFAIFNLLFFIIRYLQRNWERVEFNFSLRGFLHKKYMTKYNSLNNTQLETLGTGKTISIVSKGLDDWEMFLQQFFQIFGLLISILIGTVISLSKIGFIYVFIMFISLLVVIGILYFLNTSILTHRKKSTELSIIFDRQFVKMIMSKFEILQNDQNKKEVKELIKINNDRKKVVYKVNNYINAMFLIPHVFIFLIYIILLVSLFNNNVGISVVVSIFLMLGLLENAVNRLVEFSKNFAKNFYKIEKLWEFFDETPEIKGLKSGKTFEYINGNFKLEKIFFSYGDYNVFENFSVEIKGNQRTAFVGESGGGKTTLMKLLAGFIDVNSGNIFIDNQNLKDINLKTYYKNIGYLTQDPSVFDGSIIENLTYGNKDNIDEKKLKSAIKKARCEFIYEFKDGLKTEIGERGVRLSGGQKQRLAIAKLFIKDPKIIFLDEPTSALDSFSEELINQSFDELFKGRTVIIIAHRLQTVKKADDIIVFEKGKIIERGTHNSLVRKGGYYKKLLDLQSGF